MKQYIVLFLSILMPETLLSPLIMTLAIAAVGIFVVSGSGWRITNK